MCFAAAGIIASLAGTAISAVGAIAQGQQQQALANAQARSLEQQAEAERRAAAFESMKEQRSQSLAQSAARAQVGASGVGFEGSPTEVLTANAGQGQLDLQAIQFGSTIRQNNLRTQADISRMQGKQAKVSGFINAGSGLISGVSQLYDPRKAARLGANPFA